MARELTDFCDPDNGAEWYAQELILRRYYDGLLAADPAYEKWLQSLEPKQEQENDRHQQSEL